MVGMGLERRIREDGARFQLVFFSDFSLSYSVGLVLTFFKQTPNTGLELRYKLDTFL